MTSKGNEVSLYLDNNILRGVIKKLRMKLKMYEISFEQVNNSRNDMIKQLAECETALEGKNVSL